MPGEALEDNIDCDYDDYSTCDGHYDDDYYDDYDYVDNDDYDIDHDTDRRDDDYADDDITPYIPPAFLDGGTP